jgi:hypothetical protein
MDWLWMAVLGAYHGVNPGMGWLFAVALAMQQRSARGIWRALPPIVVGHVGSIVVVIAAAWLAQVAVSIDVLGPAVGSAMIALGFYRLRRHRHPRGAGMQVGFRDLTAWSFLMSLAHGAGLMVLPFVMPASTTVSAAHHGHATHASVAGANMPAAAMAIGFHTLTYFAVMTFIAWIVYRRLGLSILRTAWFNLDWVWAGALVVTGFVVTLM